MVPKEFSTKMGSTWMMDRLLLEALKSRISGEILQANDAGYDEARKLLRGFN
jgi:hypothetical protein